MHGINLSFEHNTLSGDPIDALMSSFGGGYVGIHDFEHPYGQNQYFDLHAIFPDMTRDTSDPSAYNFGPTDRSVAKIREYGARLIFRLGESKDCYDFKPYLDPVRYIDKIADICLHIVMHYNAGFADGYKWNLSDFEIWSGADTARGFSGTVDDYIALYRRCALLIKEKFPRVKLGGYTSLGFSGMNRVTDDAELKSASDFMERFLSAVSPRGENLPFDFLTWRAAVTSAEELSLHSKYARSMLKGYGVRAKSIVSEFDVVPKDRVPTAADYLAAMISAEKSEIDAMLYYHRGDMEAKEVADIAFSALYECDSSSDISEDYKGEIYGLAAHSDGLFRAAFATLGFSGAAEILTEGEEFLSFSLAEFVRNSDGTYSESGVKNAPVKSNKVAFAVKPYAVYILNFNKRI